MDIQLKQQLKSTLLAQIDSLMREFNISASDMQSTLESLIITIQELVLQDYIQENISQINKLNNQIQELQKEDESEE